MKGEKMDISTKTKNNITMILDSNFSYLTDYYSYSVSKNENLKSIYRRIREIDKLLEYITLKLKYEEKKNLTLLDIENVSTKTIEDYFQSKKGYKYNSLGFILYSLQHFWNYFTNYSYTVEKGKPLFYRNAINEWKIANRETYELIKKYVSGNNSKTSNLSNFNTDDLVDILDFFDNQYIFTLDTELKAKNFEKNKDKYLAAVGILMSTGITVEKITMANLKDIDLKSKTLKIDNKAITIDEFAIPYIKPYIAKRRAWWVADKQQQALFLNQNKSRVKQSFFTTVLLNLSKVYTTEISATKLRKSYEFNHR